MAATATSACTSPTPHTRLRPTTPPNPNPHLHPFPHFAPSRPKRCPLLSHPRSSLSDPLTKTQTFLWNSEIRRSVDAGRYGEALRLYRQMRSGGARPDHFTYPFVLKASSCAPEGPDDVPEIHARLLKDGFHSDVYACNSLVAAYMKTDRVWSGRQVFDEMPVRDVVSWNSIMSGFVEAGNGAEALRYLRGMQEGHGLRVDRFGVIAALMGCSLVGSLNGGKEVHCYVLRCGLGRDHMVQVSIVDMYCKCGDVVSAERFFEGIGVRSIVAWNAMIAGYGMNDRQERAVESVKRMQKEGIALDSVTMINLIPSLVELRWGKAVHGASIRKSFVPHAVLETSLINMYAKCGELTCSEMLFDKMVNRSLVSWNAMLTVYVQNGCHMEAFDLFLDLLDGSLRPDGFTISGVASACSEMMLRQEGRQIHGYALKLGFATPVLNSLAFMYAKCGDLRASERVFRGIVNKDIISWNMIIMAYAIHGQGETALKLFSEMQENGHQPNESTFVSVLSACSMSGLVDDGWRHFNSMHKDYNMDPQIEHYGCMVDLLGRAGDLDSAKSFIRRMPLAPAARIWGALLTASRNHNNIELAELVAENIFSLEHNNMGCHVILSNMYADAERWDDVERLRCRMGKEGSQRLQIRSFVDINDKIYSFVNDDRSYTQTNTIHDIVDYFSKQLGGTIYDYGSTFRIQDAILKKSSSPIRHSVRLAVCYCIASTRVGTPVLVKKNVRTCNSCHDVIKLISKISQREIIVGDSSVFHHFNDGKCSCGDYW